jgi:hypothetical protein
MAVMAQRLALERNWRDPGLFYLCFDGLELPGTVVNIGP